MAHCILLWIMLTVLTEQSCATSDRGGVSDNKMLQQHFSNSVIWWHPQYSLKEYKSFSDAKIYVLDVPTYTSKMWLMFNYEGMYSGSHKPCNNTINVLYQHGSPAIPYRDEIHGSFGWLYNYTDYNHTTVSLHRPRTVPISSPLPGKWYVTAFRRYVMRVKNIKEKGLSKADKECLSALSIIQQLQTPLKPPVILAKGQPWKTTRNASDFTTTYYRYFVSSYSMIIQVELNSITCPSQLNCSLKLSVSASILPVNPSLSCIAPCSLNITWPQPKTYYYIEVSGTSQSYQVTASHTECRPNTSECTRIIPMLFLDRKLLINAWQKFKFDRTSMFSLKLDPDYVGTVLTLSLWPTRSTTTTTYRMCIMKDFQPIQSLKSSRFPTKYCSEKKEGVLTMEVLYPQSGIWYIAVIIQPRERFSESSFVIHASTKTCLSNCNNHGSCMRKDDIGVSYGLCVCDYGYTGFACSEHHGLDVLAVCLLTISNIAFIPGIIVACSRKFYPEAVVYLFNMYCSTVYHACDSHGYCIYDYNTLQLSDFLASILSVWFTLITMIKMRSLWHRTLNIVAILCLFIGVQLARFGLLLIAIPGGIGLLFVFISFLYRCRKRRKCFPSRKRWLFFLLPAFVLASIALGIYTGLETTANYKYLHSIWHIAIASCIPLLLPTVRKPKLYRVYNKLNGDDENFHDSDESLILNMRNHIQQSEGQDPECEEITFPQLIT